MNVLLGREDDGCLLWNVPRAEILKAVQTVNGMARLSTASRMTIYRKGIPPNSAGVIEFVRDWRRDMGRPLVEILSTL